MATKTITLANYEEVADTKASAVTFTSGDSSDANASAWTSVDPVATGETHASLLNKISTMLKNIRYLYKKLGTTDISSIGNGTVTDALSTLNGKIPSLTPVTLTPGSGVTLESYAAYKTKTVLLVFARITLNAQVAAYGTLISTGCSAKCGWIAPLYHDYKVPVDKKGVYGDVNNAVIRASTALEANGVYQISCIIPIQ